jgi:hypothetical protein
VLRCGGDTIGRRAGESNSVEETERRAALGLNYSHFGIRLSGQDSERGTFNQRHAAMFDAVTHQRVSNMAHPTQDDVEVYNSPLSEASVLAFEYGHSVASKDEALVLWEAQFGDFANNAQVRQAAAPLRLVFTDRRCRFAFVRVPCCLLVKLEVTEMRKTSSDVVGIVLCLTGTCSVGAHWGLTKHDLYIHGQRFSFQIGLEKVTSAFGR